MARRLCKTNLAIGGINSSLMKWHYEGSFLSMPQGINQFVLVSYAICQVSYAKCPGIPCSIMMYNINHQGYGM